MPAPTLPSSTALAEALVRVSRAIGAYCRALMAETDQDDEASVARFMSAMAPIDAHRASSRGGTDEDGAPEQPSTPVVPTTIPTTTAGEGDVVTSAPAHDAHVA